MQISAKIVPLNRLSPETHGLAPPVWEILDPLLISSNIRTFHNSTITQEQAIKANKSGYKLVQVKINEDPLEGVKRIAEVRSILDKDTVLLVDANTGEQITHLNSFKDLFRHHLSILLSPFKGPVTVRTVNLTLKIFKLQPLKVSLQRTHY